MSELEASRKERGNLRGKFTRAVNNLTRLLNENLGTDVIARKFEELEVLWSDIEHKHDDYVSQACGDNRLRTNG